MTKRNLFAAVVFAAAVEACAVPRSATALTVFDPANYQQNLLTAFRSLDQINNQIRQLQNQAQQILQMDQQLQRLTGSISPELSRVLSELQSQLQRGSAIALNVKKTDQALERLFPKAFPKAVNSNNLVRDAKLRWDEAHASFVRAARIQASVAAANADDQARLEQLVGQSQAAVGNLQAVQAGNQMRALAIKQNLQLQTLLAANARATTMQQVRSLIGESEARHRFNTFLGAGAAYTRK